MLITAIATALALAAPAQESKQVLAVQHRRAGQQALQVERWEEAEREFKTAIEFDPLLELAHYGLGQSYMRRKSVANSERVTSPWGSWNGADNPSLFASRMSVRWRTGSLTMSDE